MSDRAIPTAGGCSVFVIAVTKIVIPTDKAPVIIYSIDKFSMSIFSTNNKDMLLKIIPEIIPTVYPPNIFFVFAE